MAGTHNLFNQPLFRARKPFSRKWNLASVWNQDTEASVFLCTQLPLPHRGACLPPTVFESLLSTLWERNNPSEVSFEVPISKEALGLGVEVLCLTAQA